MTIGFGGNAVAGTLSRVATRRRCVSTDPRPTRSARHTSTTTTSMFATRTRATAKSARAVRAYAAGLNKTTLIEHVAKETGETKASVGRVLNATLDAISATVRGGDKVALSKFGTFARKQRKARDGRNPLTGAALKIPAANYPSFSASSAFKDLVKGKK